MSGLCKLGLQQIVIKVEKLNPRIIIIGCTCLLLNTALLEPFIRSQSYDD